MGKEHWSSNWQEAKYIGFGAHRYPNFMQARFFVLSTQSELTLLQNEHVEEHRMSMSNISIGGGGTWPAPASDWAVPGIEPAAAAAKRAAGGIPNAAANEVGTGGAVPDGGLQCKMLLNYHNEKIC